jgi:alcohol dehydrogenase class IV
MGIPAFSFSTAQQILFGAGLFQNIGKMAQGLGKRAFLVLGFQNKNTESLEQMLEENGIVSSKIIIDKEPTTSAVRLALELAANSDSEIIIGFGGGSAIDTAKAVAVLRNNPGDLFDYLEVIGKSKPIIQPALPCIAIPTTAGTGAEVTRNAVIASPSDRVKVSLRSPYMLPRMAIVDPELTLSLPKSVTASTGLDALTQLIEPFVSKDANPLTDALCKEGMKHAARSLRKAYVNGNDLVARSDMCIASLFGGLALANSKLGAVHGFAGVIGGMCNGPHGAICARLLPPVIAVNIQALKNRDPESLAIQKFAEVACILTGSPAAKVQDGVAWIEELVKEFSIPPLTAYGMKSSDIPEVVEQSTQASSMKGNPVVLTHDELETILVSAL